MVHWERLALDRTTRRLAGLIRREYGLWIGFADANGLVVPVGGCESPILRPICARYIANAGGGLSGDCAGSLCAWARGEGADGTAQCHAGFSALIAAVRTGGVDRGVVYASGFVCSEHADAQTELVLQRIRIAGLWPEADAAMIPRLNPAQRECVAALLRTMAQVAVEGDRGDGITEIARTSRTLPEAIERLERLMILEGLRRTGWNKTRTAREIGISRRNLIRKVAQYELEEE